MNPKTFEIYRVTSPQKSYPSSFSTLQEILNRVREAIREAFKKNAYKQQ